MAIDVGSAVAFLDLDTSGFKSGISTALTQIRLLNDTSLSTEARLASLGSGLQTLGRSLSKSVTLPLSEKQSIECKFSPIRIEKNENGGYTISGRFDFHNSIDKMTLIQFCTKRSIEIKNK